MDVDFSLLMHWYMRRDGTLQVRENRDNDGLLGDDNMRRQIRREKMMLDSRRHARFT